MPRRATGTCSQRGCLEPPARGGRCETHAEPAWAGSRQRREELGGHVDRRLRDQVRRRARNHCHNCGALPRPGERFVVDHIVPVGAGGRTTPDNLQLLCPACDTPKTALDLARMRHPATRG